jgi:hypothetical protein
MKPDLTPLATASYKESAIPGERSGLPDGIEYVGRRIFIDGQRIQVNEWLSCTEKLVASQPPPVLVVILAKLRGMHWQEVHQFRKAIVAKGGILADIGSLSFADALREWSQASELPPMSVPAPDPQAGVWDWGAHQAFYLTDEEFEQFQKSAAREASDSSIMS